MLRLEGFEASVAHRSRELVRALGRFGAARVVEGPGDWAWIRDAAGFAGRDGAVWRVSVKPTDGARLAEALAPAEMIFDWAGGLVHARAPEDFDLRAAMAGIPGHATLIRSGGDALRGSARSIPSRTARRDRGGSAREIRPSGILNPGRTGARAAVPA